MKKYVAILLFFIIFVFVIFSLYLEDLKKRAVRSYVDSTSSHIRAITGLLEEQVQYYFSYLEKLSEEKSIIQFDERGKELLKLFYTKKIPYFRAISRVSRDMKLVYTVPENPMIGVDLSGQAHNRIIAKEHKPIVSSPFMAVQGYKAISLHYPVFNEGKYAGAVAILLDFESFIGNYFKGFLKESFHNVKVIDSNGIILFSSKKSEEGKAFEETYRGQGSFLTFYRAIQEKGNYFDYFLIAGPGNSHEKYIGVSSTVNLTEYNSWKILSYTSLASILGILKLNYLYLGISVVLFLIVTFVSGIAYMLIERKKIELEVQLEKKTNALKNSEKRLRLMFDGMKELVLLSDENGKVEYANRSLVKILGYNPVGKGRTDIFAKGIGITGREYSIQNYTLINDDGRRMELTMMHDITEKKKFEKQMQQLFAAINTADEIVIISDERRRINYVNDAFVRILKIERNKILGKRVESLFKVMGSFQLYKKIEKSIISRGAWKGEFSVRIGKSKLVRLSAGITPFFTTVEKKSGYIGIIRDMTKERQQEQTLKRIMEHAPIIIQVIDLDYRIVSTNKVFYELTGWDETDTIGKNIFDFCVPKDEEPNVKQVILESKGTLNKAQKVLKADGGIIYVSWINIPLLDANGKRYATLSLGINVTREKELEHRYLQAQKMEAIGRFAGGIAHDFNNYLTAMMGNIELMKMARKTDEPIDENLEELQSIVERSASLTKRLLNLSRRSSHSNPEYIDFNVIIRNMEKMFKRIIRENIEMELSLDTNLPRVKMAPELFEQMLMNLVVNASDAMPEGGKLTIKTEKISNDDKVKISIRDSGTGMDEETLQHVFEPFFSTKEKGKGTGLGLATVYRIASDSNGVINVNTRKGKGTDIEIVFPAESRVYIKGVEHEEREKNIELQHRRSDYISDIMIVEDDPNVRNVLYRTLTRYGYRVIEASNGQQALESLETTHKLDLLITDVIMPGMDGTKLVRRLLINYPNLKVIFVSGYSENFSLFNDVKKENMRFLGKPYSMDEMLFLIRSLI